MYWIFNGVFYGSEDEAKKVKEDLVKNGCVAKNEPIIKRKLW